MKAIVERTDLAQATSQRYVETPYLPVALCSLGNAHVFTSFAEAGAWVDNWGAPHGAFVVRRAVDPAEHRPHGWRDISPADALRIITEQTEEAKS